MILLINGKKRSGKDFVANKLKLEFEALDKRVRILSFADKLKDIVCSTFNISRETLDIYKNNNQRLYINVDGSFVEISDFRSILQRLGTEGIKSVFGQNVWRELVEKEIATDYENDIFIVPDFRFLSEEIYNSVTIKILGKNSNNTDTHLSETELDSYVFDFNIDNTDHELIDEEIEEFMKLFCRNYDIL